jgi:hypothetical protein
MKIDEFSKLLIENAMSQLEEKSKCNHSGAGTSCPTHGDADCNSSKKNRAEQVELMPEELVGTTYEAVLETGETIILEKEKGLDGKACWKGYKQMGTKKKGGKTVDNCVKAGYEPEGDVIKEKKDMPGSQEKIDANKNGKVDAHDFALLRAKKGKKSVKEMWEISEAKTKTKIEIMPNISDDPTEQGEKQSSEISSDAKNSKYDSKKKKMKEEVELEEKKLSAAEVAKKEKVVKGMKKKFGTMKSKYGDKAQSVMYGAATNIAKKKA